MDSVKFVVNDSGLPVKRIEYLPYGETWFEEGEQNHAPKYNSQELDKETGYYYYNARHYDPEIARFVTADNVIDGEMDTQGWNRYSYVKGNPIVYKDPTGHYIEEGGAEYDGPQEEYTGMDQYDFPVDDTSEKTRKKLTGNNLDLPKCTKYSRGAKFRKEMLASLTKSKSQDGKAWTMIGKTKVSLVGVKDPYRSIKEMSDKSLTVLADMSKKNQLSSITLTSMARSPETKNDPHQYGKGRGLDITAATRKVGRRTEYARFRDKPDYRQPNEPALAKRLKNWLRNDSRVSQVYTAWSMNAKPNRNETQNEKIHKTHMHVTIRPD